MKVYLISDTHFNPAKIATYCDRPENFTEILIRNWRNTINPMDMVIHIGDVFIGGVEEWREIYPKLPGKKMLIRGNHDDQRSLTWWMSNGFDAACDAMIFRSTWITHRPADQLPPGCQINIHGHLHNIWDGFYNGDICDRIGGCLKRADPSLSCNCDEDRKKLKNPWQRLFAVEYTNYHPIEFDKFLNHPDRYQARGKI